MEDLVLNFISNVIDAYPKVSYFIFFISSFLQVTFPPYPGDMIAIFSGYLITVSGLFSIPYVLITTISGTVLGSFRPL